MDTYPDTFAFVQIHLGDSYATPWGNARGSFYGVPGYPTSWFDGTIERVGAHSYATYHSDYLNRYSRPTDVVLDLTGEQVSGQTFEITATLELAPGGNSKYVTVYIVQVLDRWPLPPSYSRNGFKQAAQEVTVLLQPGNTQEVVRTMTFDSDSWGNQDNIRIIAWAQVPGSPAPRAVYQAAIMNWPFPSPNLVGDMNCDGVLDGFDVDPFVMAMVDPAQYAIQFPDCDINNGDINGDGDIDAFDIDPFVELVIGP